MPRLFTGLEIPTDIGFSLSLQRGGLSGARWIDPANYHITLRFIGDVDHSTAREAASILGEGRMRSPLPITIEGLDTFGGSRPRALFARVVPAPALQELQAEQERLLRRIGLEPERRKFTPHVTLARLRDCSAQELARHLTGSGHFAKLRFTAPRFVLFSSRDSVGGGPYVVEAAYPFAGAETLEREAAWR